MPVFRSTLPPEGKNVGFSLKRTPANGALLGICTSAKIVVVDTHYWHGRTMPCERICDATGALLDDGGCAACQQKQPFRTHTYVSAICPKTHVHFLFECTGIAAKPFAEYIEANGTLRGCIFNASRPKGGVNSKVVIVTNTANLTRVTLPAAPHIANALAVIWRLPKQAIYEEDVGPSTTLLQTDEKELAEIRHQESNANGQDDFIKRREAVTQEFFAAAAAKSNGRTKRGEK
jgi:hypothetical protein